MIDVEAMEQRGAPEGVLMCGWRKRGKTAKALAKYRRHWRREHGAPFLAETRALMRWLARPRDVAQWGGRGVEAQVTVSKGWGDPGADVIGDVREVMDDGR